MNVALGSFGRMKTWMPTPSRLSLTTTCFIIIALSPTTTPWRLRTNKGSVYLFYYFSYLRRNADRLCEEILQEFHVRTQDTLFIQEATEQLQVVSHVDFFSFLKWKNYNVLRHSYVYGFYLTSESEKNLFEYIQEDLVTLSFSISFSSSGKIHDALIWALRTTSLSSWRQLWQLLSMARKCFELHEGYRRRTFFHYSSLSHKQYLEKFVKGVAQGLTAESWSMWNR